MEVVKSPKSYVVVTHAESMDYRRDYVTLPQNYGSSSYFQRPDIRGIQEAVEKNLQDLDSKTGFTCQIANRKVVIKPNLVLVYSGMGTLGNTYPQTTDPRVLDSVILFLKRYTQHIVIAESSGRGMPTHGSFKVAGIDRLARYHGVELMALEEQPTDRYILPKAKVHKEIVVPRIFSEVAGGDAYYISIPKMKTNLYTGVTLGFKNAMGTIPYNLRQRNHNFNLDQKLVDMLYLFKPNLTIIDGIIGGQGNCPAPVEPVDSHVIISGNHAVETDRVAARMMGFDPDEINLIRIAGEMGFGDPQVEVIGDQKVIPFQPADPSLTNDAFHDSFPNVHVLIGHDKRHAPVYTCLEECAQRNVVGEMEQVCRGGCLALTRFGFEMLRYEGARLDFKLTVIIGAGSVINDCGETSGKTDRYYFDRDGKTYTMDDIARIKTKKLAVGSCTQNLKSVVDIQIDGCMPYPNSSHVAIHRLVGHFCRVMTPKNRHLFPLLFATFQTCEKRKSQIRAGNRLDVDLKLDDRIVEPRSLTTLEQQKDFIRWDPEPLTEKEIRDLTAIENRAVLASLIGG